MSEQEAPNGWVEPKQSAAEAQAWKERFYGMCEDQLVFLQEKLGDFTPRMGVVLGSGLGGLAHHEVFEEAGHVAFEAIPGMTKPGTGGHEGKMYWGHIGKLPVMLWAGRVQTTDYYQWDTTPARAARLATSHLTVAKGLGVETFVLTSAAGIVHTHGEKWRRWLYFLPPVQKGDVIAIADYTSFMPLGGPLLAPYDNRFGERFNGKGNILDPRLLRYLKNALGDHYHVGSYVLSPSTPNFEGALDLLRSSPSEAFIAQSPQSITVVGMSMPPEMDIVNAHNDKPYDVHGFDRPARLLALSLGTNDIPPVRLPTSDVVFKRLSANPATHKEVSQEGKSAEERLIPAFADVCEHVAAE